MGPSHDTHSCLEQPFNLNDRRDPAQRKAAIYHWTPDVRDYNDPLQEQIFQMSWLDDLNTETAAVRRALRESYGHWIRDVGVDAFRVDTAFYVPPDYFRDFLHARDPRAPGIAAVVRATGRRYFMVFGEGFGIDAPGIDAPCSDAQSRKIESSMSDALGHTPSCRACATFRCMAHWATPSPVAGRRRHWAGASPA